MYVLVHVCVQEYGDEPTLEQLLAMAEGSEDWQPPVDPDVRDDPILEVDIKVQQCLHWYLNPV